MTGTPSRRQLRCREAGWEGSPRQNPDPRNTNRMKAFTAGRGCLQTRTRQSSGAVGVDAAGIGGKSHVLPREICPAPRGRWQKSAEVVGVVPQDDKGPNAMARTSPTFRRTRKAQPIGTKDARTRIDERRQNRRGTSPCVSAPTAREE